MLRASIETRTSTCRITNRQVFPKLVMSVLLAFSLAVTQALAAETLRVVSFLPRNHPLMIPALEWLERTNSAMKGRLELEWVGGPEAIPVNHQVEAVRNGVVELTITTTSNYQDELPEVSAFTLSRLSPSEERKSGFHDFMVEAHQTINTRYIGRVNHSPFYLYLKDRPDELTDLKGRTVRTGTLYNRFLSKLEMVPITISSSETFTALERGVIDSFVWQSIGPRQYGWLEEISYIVDLPFFHAGNVVVLMNLDTWNSLPAQIRKEIDAVTRAFEPWMVSYYETANQEEREQMTELGIQPVRFTDAENRKYIETAYEVEWAAIAERAPRAVQALKRMTGT